MNKFLIGIAVGLLSTGSAQTDPVFYNATPGSYKIIATIPNGNKDDRTVNPASTGLSSGSFTLAYTRVWSGTVKDSDTWVLVPGDKGARMVYASYQSSTAVPALVLMNSTGEAMTVDLTGDNGGGGHPRSHAWIIV